MLDAQLVADWLMNEDGNGATDEQFLETIQLMERKIEHNLSDDYTFLDWLKDVIEEIEENLEDKNVDLIGGIDMKTDKFNNMISSFQCDFSLAKENDNDRRLADLDDLIAAKDENLLRDIELLEELEWMLRNGKAEIHIVE